MDNKNQCNSTNNDCCIEGINCDVSNCIHNDHQCGCTAKQIKVGPTFATTCNDTVCKSFKEQA